MIPMCITQVTFKNTVNDSIYYLVISATFKSNLEKISLNLTFGIHKIGIESVPVSGQKKIR